MTKHTSKFNNTEAPIAEALRKAGFISLPRLWVKSADMPEIHRIAKRHSREVNSIRGRVRRQLEQADPLTDKDAAWNAAEQQRKRS